MNNISQALATSGFKTIDFLILIVYLILLVGLGLFLSRNKGGKEKTANDYFLAGNTLTWWAVGASLIAANISAEQFIGMSGTGFRDGIAIAAYEVMAAITLVVIGKFLLPVMLDRKIFTIPQFLRERYNDGVGLAFSILWLFLYVFVNLTSVAWLGALAIEQILGLQGMAVSIFGIEVSMRMLIIFGLFLVAGIYSIYGGLASVAWTDVMQVTFLVGGGLITAYVALSEMAGVFGTDTLGALGKVFHDLTTGAHAQDVHFHLVIQQSHNADAFANVPGIAAVVGGVWLTNLGYWGFNQYIIQKGLAAKNIDEAKKGLVFAGFLKILIPFIVVLPGICAYYIMQNPDAFAGMNLQGKINVADDAYPWLIRNFTPTGIKGLSFAALTAAIISSLASMFNSTSTLFTMDIYKKYINRNAGDKQLVGVGRLVAVAALVIALVAVKPLLGGLDQAFQYIQEYSGFIYPGIIVVFGLGLLWKRASSLAARGTGLPERGGCRVDGHPHHPDGRALQGDARRRGLPVPRRLHLHHPLHVLRDCILLRQEDRGLRATLRERPQGHAPVVEDTRRCRRADDCGGCHRHRARGHESRCRPRQQPHRLSQRHRLPGLLLLRRARGVVGRVALQQLHGQGARREGTAHQPRPLCHHAQLHLRHHRHCRDHAAALRYPLVSVR